LQLDFLMPLAFRLPPTAPHFPSARSAWLRARFAAFAQSSVLLLWMAALTVAAFAQSSVLLLWMAALTVAAFAQSSVLSPASLRGCARGVAVFYSVLSPQPCFSAWLRARGRRFLLSTQSSVLSTVSSVPAGCLHKKIHSVRPGRLPKANPLLPSGLRLKMRPFLRQC
jgi:hypothetical protein